MHGSLAPRTRAGEGRLAETEATLLGRLVKLFSERSFSEVSVCQPLSRVRLFAIPWTLAHQVPLSMEFFRQEYQSGLPCPSPGDLPDPGTEPRSPALQADALPAECGHRLGIGDNAGCVSGGLGPGRLHCVSNG